VLGYCRFSARDYVHVASLLAYWLVAVIQILVVQIQAKQSNSTSEIPSTCSTLALFVSYWLVILYLLVVTTGTGH
jgi:hypothetical protein